MSYVLSVNVGREKRVGYSEKATTGIDKRPVDGPVQVSTPGPRGRGGSGLAGDHISNLRHHGGDHQAVYLYAREDLDWWETELDRPLANGTFGENLTTIGLDVSGAVIGEVWAIGPQLQLQLTDPRIPCRTFAGWLSERGWIKRFTAVARPGIYARVLQPGFVTAGDIVRVLSRPDHVVTVAYAFRALTLESDLLPDLLPATSLAPETWESVARRVATVR